MGDAEAVKAAGEVEEASSGVAAAEEEEADSTGLSSSMTGTGEAPGGSRERRRSGSRLASESSHS